jgi:hypothetical protein
MIHFSFARAEKERDNFFHGVSHNFLTFYFHPIKTGRVIPSHQEEIKKREKREVIN